jgi:L-serine dehydratase
MKTINPPGIFNDVIGPVMRGPSSSHTAGSHRIGNVIKQFASSGIKKADFYFHPGGSLATTYQTQGSDIGLAAGLMGMEITDPDMDKSLVLIEKHGIDLSFHISDYTADHPNTYRCIFETNKGEIIQVTALSTGGGIIEFTEIQGIAFKVQMDLPTLIIHGKSKEVILWWENTKKDIVLQSQVYRHQINTKDDDTLLVIEFSVPNPRLGPVDVKDCFSQLILPVYPVMGYAGSFLPFQLANDLEERQDLGDLDLADLAIEYETIRSAIPAEEVLKKMDGLVDIFMEAIDKGLSGTEYKNRIVHSQSPGFLDKSQKGKLLPAGPLDKITAYTMAIMEAKSAMEIIIAAPTAGAAGGLPGALIGMAEEMSASRDQLIKAFLASGIVGVFITAEATFAAEVAGCQAETGAGAGMAAAGLVQLGGGSAKQAMGAASVALQNILGLVCDPVGNRVEIPCLSRNVQVGANALVSANMILGGVDPVIPLSETIQTLMEIGKSLPRSLRCTALGGLAITKTAKRIEKDLNNIM